jgi:FixJ family two-component response regulator
MTTPKPLVAVLDDEPEMRKALRRLLTGRGFSVEEYEHGQDLLTSIGSRPLDCLLLDLHMAEVSGFDVLEAFQSRHIPVPVIVITAHDEPDTEDRVRSLGACAYLKKPVDRDALLAAIADAIERPYETVAPQK